MEKLNETELIHELSRLDCFSAKNADSPNCKKLFDLLIPKNESSNNSYNHFPRVNDDYSIISPVSIASYALAIFLNCTILWMMYKDPLKRFRTPSALFIACLAVFDLLGACFSLAIEEETRNPEYDPSESTTLYLPWLVVTTAQSSYYTVILISCERYAAIAHPFRYRVLVVMKYSVIAILISLLLAFAISTSLFFTHEPARLPLIGNQIYAINTFILIAILLVLYPLTHSSLRRQRKQVLTMNASNKRLRTNKLKLEKNFANTMFLVCFSLILFTSPYVVMFFFTTTDCDSCILNNYFLHIWMYFRIFFAMHFGVNPVIYAWRLPCYRKSLHALLQKLVKRDGRNTNQPKRSVTTPSAHRENTGATHIETGT